jgi:hypothetical protein
MSSEAAILLGALGLTVAVAGAVAGYLHRPLKAVLRDLCGTDERAKYWAAFADVVHLLLPVTVVLLAREPPRAGVPVVLAVLDQARWALVGLTGSVVAVALGVAVFLAPRAATIVVDRDQADDLQRLLGKVQALRARDVLGPAPRGDTPG